MRKDILTLVKAASDNGITSEITASGALLFESTQKILDSGLDSLSISLDGLEEIHHRIRTGNENLYQKIIASLRKINKLKLKYASPVALLQIIMTLTVENQNTVYDVYEIARKEGDIFRLQFGIFTSEKVEK